MKIKKGQLLELDISGIAFGGKGIAKINGLTVFVEKTVPMDRVVARIVKKKRQYAEAFVDTLVMASPFRITAKCMYSGFCGGCKWQFIQYQKQLEYKQQHVVESIERIGQIQGVPVHPTIPSPEIFEYRNKMEFSCSDRRWLLPDELKASNIDKGVALGLHVPGTFYKVIDIRECLLQPELGNRILDDVRRFVRTSGIPVYGLRSHTGFWRFLMLRHSAAYNHWMVNIITSKEDLKTVQPLADQLVKTYSEIVSVVNNVTARRAGIAMGEYENLLFGQPCIRDKIGEFEFEISANSFFQTNTRGAQRLYENILAYADLSGRETVLDLYCGTGAIAIFLSGAAKTVVGIEIADSAVNDARNNCRINKISNCRFILGDIKEKLSELTATPDVMIIDPPRAGMHKDVVHKILELAPSRIVYVSCNPATMARDFGMLKENYSVLEVQPVDMFPHTYHIESVARLEKKNLK
ncbi:MAG: 23S rRNA (uracil(1939)-C(5))-methyltransferase RlmD [Deltaproteobacteria bacterium]|jgi:23S rRNA (uracil1939-C5)-methyltransferase|nr:23S rRNA (uracil(1939)-C(5))-methyltransferase RlmD [Deltaproteobacteria bacterium]